MTKKEVLEKVYDGDFKIEYEGLELEFYVAEVGGQNWVAHEEIGDTLPDGVKCTLYIEDEEIATLLGEKFRSKIKGLTLENLAEQSERIDGNVFLEQLDDALAEIGPDALKEWLEEEDIVIDATDMSVNPNSEEVCDTDEFVAWYIDRHCGQW